MNSVECKELLELVVDEDYEGMLSSYMEKDALRKFMLNEEVIFSTKSKNIKKA